MNINYVGKVHPCKACGETSHWIGDCDFSKRTEDEYPRCGVAIQYFICGSCAMVFTPCMDNWTREDWAKNVYNSEYAAIDPDYAETRPSNNAYIIGEILRQLNLFPSMMLDYGCGNGEFIRKIGMACAGYDPMVEKYSTRPNGKFDCITCLEVMEHSSHPASLMDDFASLLSDKGIVITSTQLVPDPICMGLLGWWYIAPRCGHVSIYSKMALDIMAKARGMKFGIIEGINNGAFQYFQKENNL